MSKLVLRMMSDFLMNDLKKTFPFAQWHVDFPSEDCLYIYYRKGFPDIWIEWRISGFYWTCTATVIALIEPRLVNHEDWLGDAYREHLARQEAAALESLIPAVESKRRNGRL